MTWTDAAANSEQWGELALAGEVQALDESSNVLLDESGNELVVGTLAPWSATAANAETWVDA